MRQMGARSKSSQALFAAEPKHKMYHALSSASVQMVMVLIMHEEFFPSLLTASL
jgi:hypothetical protein